VLYDRIVGDTNVEGGALYFKKTDSIPDRTFDVLGVEPKLEHLLNTGPVGHTFDVGVRFLAESGHRAERAGETPTSDAGALLLDEDHHTYAFSGYVHDRMAFRSWLIVTPGFRIEHAQYVRNVNRAVTTTVPQDTNVEGGSFVTGVVPGLGMVLGPPSAHAFGGIHVGFAPPRVTTALATTGVDQQLDAEKSINYEAGGRVAYKKLVRAELTGFLSSFENQIIPGNALTGAKTTLINGGATRHLGLESGLVVKIGDALKAPLTVDLGGTYTLSRATFVGGDFAGKALPYAPLHTGSGTLDVEHASGVGGQVAGYVVSPQFTDEKETVAVDPSGRIGRIEAYGVMDVALRYKNKHTGLTASVTVKNLLDTTYVQSRRPDGIFIGQPRQITAGLRFDTP
jgi:Fe(3+) dicitrate transport protein